MPADSHYVNKKRHFLSHLTDLVLSGPPGLSLWWSCRHRTPAWMAQTASSSPHCTGARRSLATMPPSWWVVEWPRRPTQLENTEGGRHKVRVRVGKVTLLQRVWSCTVYIPILDVIILWYGSSVVISGCITVKSEHFLSLPDCSPLHFYQWIA